MLAIIVLLRYFLSRGKDRPLISYHILLTKGMKEEEREVWGDEHKGV